MLFTNFEFLEHNRNKYVYGLLMFLDKVYIDY